MKKLLLLFACITISYLAKAQSSEFHAFKFDIDLGYATASGAGIKGGATFTLEPQYRLSAIILLLLGLMTVAV